MKHKISHTAFLLGVLLAPASCSAPQGSSQDGAGDGRNGGGGLNDAGQISIPSNGDGDATGNGDTVPGGESTCPDLKVEFTSPIPNVMVLVDRSSSMFEKAFSPSLGGDRWVPTKEAIVGEDNVLERFEDAVNFGFSAYTAKSDQPCPIVEPVLPALNNFSAIAAAYDEVSTNVGGDTPTGAAITAVAEKLLQGPPPYYIILATDGEPDTCEHLNPQCGQDDSVAAIQAAYDKGVQTFVIGISSDVSEQHLQDIANAGRGEPVAPPVSDGSCDWIIDYENPKGTYSDVGGSVPFYTPDSPEALSGVLEELVGGIRSCSFELAGTVASEAAGTGTVTLGDQPPLQYGTDWIMPNESTVLLQGDACVALQTLNGALDIDFPCGTYVVR